MDNLQLSSDVMKIMAKLFSEEEGFLSSIDDNFDLDAEEITIDGININNYNLHDLRSQIGLLYQTTAIFNNTIRYNLVFSNDEKFDEEIWESLKQVEM